MRFFHTADIHLAKPFGRFDEDTRAALRSARLEALGWVGQEASARGAEFVLVAGDTFDAEAPPLKTVQWALDAMGEFPDLVWVLMPGNHDSLAAVDLWERIGNTRPDNVILALKPEIIEIGNDVAILPAPLTVRNPGLDPTEWMTGAETGDRFRIGLAHGGVVDFGSEEGTVTVIPPDRAEQSSLDYLALGDWHGRKSISARTWYSGSPEADSFKGHGAAGALQVDIARPGDIPDVTPVPTGVFDWRNLRLDFRAGTDPVEQVSDALPDSGRKKMLVHIEASGRLGLGEQRELHAYCNDIVNDFHFFEISSTGLRVERVADDLDVIAESGALRAAADSLSAATDPQGRTGDEVQIAEIALTHLFNIAQEEQAS